MRRPADRVRHAVSFEVIGLSIITPLAAWVFDKPMSDIGVIAIVGATIATVWNYLYNLGFDHLMVWLRGSVHKTVGIRVVHAIIFETGLLLILLPFIAWQLEIGLWEALVMDISFALFYLVYTFVFNWLYDIVFPIDDARTQDASENAEREGAR
ncbi:PACE efflux transporter [Nitratireductor basaltis]|uniref:Putative membrane protein n=1 Tax=Nitratireductor basaltis TaxID=472175 RepID=A0A084U648_9HYPH|nr:PACE efflux transporter [Nitratireductor basaltis]KFB08434.1 putative membrane protein [Nitratireductor basaltis]